ncbi:MAG: PhoH family protein [Coriobacteriales bacterium]
MESTRVSLKVPQSFDMRGLVGPQDRYLHMIESRFNSKITVRGDTITIVGDPVENQVLTSLFSDCIKTVEEEGELSDTFVEKAIDLVRSGEFAPSALRDDILLTYRGKAVRPKTAGQKKYADAIARNTITFGIGPAGTGKTYLAMAMAVAALKRKEVGRIVLSRPVVEAGESLGYLPGTLNEKIDPYVRPLYDALFEMVDTQHANSLLEQDAIEIAPLAYMRGRTLNDCFIILDEAQNTTPQQMKMFLTRLGFGSKMVVTGDITQIDLPRGESGLVQVRDILDGIKGIAFCNLTGNDVVRHSLVQKIVSAYDAASSREKGSSDEKKGSEK